MTAGRNMRTGFTLLEILIVVIVIGILAALVIPQVSGAAEDAKVSKILSVVDSLRVAVQTHYADTGTLAREYSNSTDEADRELSVQQTTVNWDGPYLSNPLTDGSNPFGGIVRVYEDFTEGPIHPVGFDLIGRGTDTAVEEGQYVIFTNVSEVAAESVDKILDQGVGGNWRNTGRVEWQNNAMMIFLMDIYEK